MTNRTFDAIMTVLFSIMGVLFFLAMVEGGKSLGRLLLALAGAEG